MASLLKREGSRFWYVRYQVDGKRYFRSTGEEKKSKAEIRMQEMLAGNRSTASVDQLFGIVLDRVSELSGEQQKVKRHDFARQLLAGSDAKVQISDAWLVWEKSPRRGNPKESTVAHYEGIWLRLRKWLHESSHNIRFIHEISPTIAEEYAGELWASGITPRTYNAHTGFLRSMFGVLSIRAGITENVWKRVPSMSHETESRRELTSKELSKVCKTAEGTLRYMFAIGIYTGMRLGDVCLLRWDNVDLQRGVIEFVPMKTKRKNKTVTLPIHPSLQELLKELRPKQGSVDSYLLPDVAEEYQRNPTAISRRIREHFENCGIQTVEESGSTHRRNAIVRVGFHSLRHSFVSLCAGKGVPEVALMELVGHGSPAMTRLYSHAGTEQKAKAVAALPKIAFAAKGGAE